MLAISLIIACSRYTYNGVILHAHPVCGESHNQRNATGEVATQENSTKQEISKKIKHKIRVANAKNKCKMSKFSQKHAQCAFSSKLKRQKCHKNWEKSNLQNRTLQKTSPKNKQISIKTSPKTSNPQVFKKNPQLHRKTSPNSRGKRKVGNTDEKCHDQAEMIGW